MNRSSANKKCPNLDAFNRRHHKQFHQYVKKKHDETTQLLITNSFLTDDTMNWNIATDGGGKSTNDISLFRDKHPESYNGSSQTVHRCDGGSKLFLRSFEDTFVD